MSDVFDQSNIILTSKKYPEPKQGEYYTSSGDYDLKSVSIIAYGYDKTALIIDSNTILQSRRLDQTTRLPELHKDDRIWLPADSGV